MTCELILPERILLETFSGRPLCDPDVTFHKMARICLADPLTPALKVKSLKKILVQREYWGKIEALFVGGTELEDYLIAGFSGWSGHKIEHHDPWYIYDAPTTVEHSRRLARSRDRKI